MSPNGNCLFCAESTSNAPLNLEEPHQQHHAFETFNPRVPSFRLTLRLRRLKKPAHLLTWCLGAGLSLNKEPQYAVEQHTYTLR